MRISRGARPAHARRRWIPAALAATIVATMAAAPGAVADSAGATARVSVSSSGAQGTGGGFPSPVITPDGRFVTFSSRALGLVADDTNGKDDVFVHDRTTGVTTRESLTGAGGQAGGGSFFPDITPDGRYVAFASGAADLVPGDENAVPPAVSATPEINGRDVFVRDRQARTTTRVSVGPGGIEGKCFNAAGVEQPCSGVANPDPSITSDGRYVAFSANATNLVAGDTNAQADVFVYDRQAATTTRVNLGPAGVQAVGGASIEPSISADGRLVAYQSAATNLVAGDTNAANDIFVYDRAAGTTTRVSVASDGSQASGGSGGSLRPAMTQDGRYVAFTSAFANLVPGDTNARTDIFVHDRATATTTRVSVGAGGTEGNEGSFQAAISEDGRYVSFDSTASNLVAGDTNGVSDVFVYDRPSGTTTRASLTRSAGQAQGSSFSSSITADGRFVAFSSDAANLVAGDTNGAPDVFVHDRSLPPLTAAGYRLAATDGGVFAFGGASFLGSTGAQRLNQPIVGSAATPSGHGYWLVARDGGIFAFGKATFFGSTGAMKLGQPIVAMATTPQGQGYWLVAADGAVYPFGDARTLGPTHPLKLAQPIVGMAPTPSGKGYWLVARDGGIFAFGDAAFRGSTGAMRLSQPIVGMAATPSGQGYWLVAGDGGVFALGDAAFLGSAASRKLAQPVVGMAANVGGGGYWLVARDGGVFAFGDASFRGSTGAMRLSQPIVGITAS